MIRSALGRQRRRALARGTSRRRRLRGRAQACGRACRIYADAAGLKAPAAKVFEATQAVADGADEIDMVINVGWLKDGQTDAVRDEIRAIKSAIGTRVLKVIIETCYLSDAEKVLACTLAVEAGVDFMHAVLQGRDQIKVVRHGDLAAGWVALVGLEHRGVDVDQVDVVGSVWA